MRTVYFHEDDFCQIELLPAENWEYCTRELGQIAEFSDQHRAPNGLGWTDVYARDEAKKKLSELALAAGRVSEALRVFLPEFDRVETGYGSHVEQCSGTKGFGFDHGCVMFMSESETSEVDHIWLGLNGPERSASSALISALGKLNDLAPMILVDWGWGRVISLADSATLNQYCDERRERFKQIQEDMQRQREPERRWWRFW